MFMRDARKMFGASKEEVNEAKTGFAVGNEVSFKWPSSISMSVPQKNRKPGGFVKGILTKVDRTRAKVKIGNKVYGVATSDLTMEMKKEEVNEQLSAKFSKDFDKEAKEKGPHQDSSVYKQMRNIIKTQGFANVKTDKGSLKVDMQSAYRWLASYHMLSDKNKKNLIKMAQRSKDSLATTIRVAQTLTVRR